MEVFRLEFDKKDATYNAGDTVTGKIIIENKKIVRARNLQILIDGKAESYYLYHEAPHKRDTVRDGDCKGNRTWIKYLDIRQTLWQSDDGQLISGNHSFPFSFELPLNCAPSFYGSLGHITYQIHVRLDMIGWIEKKFSKYFRIREQHQPYPVLCSNNLVEKFLSKRYDNGFGLISAIVMIPKTGYTPRETVPITVSFDNQSKSTVVGIKVQLMQKRIYKQLDSWNYKYKSIRKSYTEYIRTKLWSENKIDLDVPPNNTEDVAVKLRIPKYMPVLNTCEIIDIEYYLYVKILVSKANERIKIDIPISIGSHPEEGYQAGSSTAPIGPPVLSAYGETCENEPPKIEQMREKKGNIS